MLLSPALRKKTNIAADTKMVQLTSGYNEKDGLNDSLLIINSILQAKKKMK